LDGAGLKLGKLKAEFFPNRITWIMGKNGSNQKNFNSKAQTGTRAKGYLGPKIIFSLVQIPKTFFTISPLGLVTDEIPEIPIFQDVKKFQNLNSPYFAMTNRYFSKSLCKILQSCSRNEWKRLNYNFDEQHLYKESRISEITLSGLTNIWFID